ncbi:GntR family transcriptional regulator [Cupriavidus sp. IDO]|nr:GntR family transcriptional regulator [Cupriavidus sp. IDO]
MPRSSPVAPSPARVPGTSLHRQLFMVLRDEITRGMYAESGALPKEEKLCERFGVSRITVRRALADLAALGLVERRHGLGTFIKANTLVTRRSPTLSVIDGLRQTARETEVEVLNVEHVPAPPDVAALLQLEPGEAAVHALRLRKMEGVPVMLTDTWVPAALGKRVSAAALRKHALFEILMAQGVKFGRVVQEITAQLADPTYAGWLQTEVGAPLLKLVRLLHDPEEHPIQYLTVYLTPERSRILMDIPAEQVNTLSAGQVVHDVLAKSDF